MHPAVNERRVSTRQRLKARVTELLVEAPTEACVAWWRRDVLPEALAQVTHDEWGAREAIESVRTALGTGLRLAEAGAATDALIATVEPQVNAIRPGVEAVQRHALLSAITAAAWAASSAASGEAAWASASEAGDAAFWAAWAACDGDRVAGAAAGESARTASWTRLVSALELRVREAQGILEPTVELHSALAQQRSVVGDASSLRESARSRERETP